MRYPSDQKQKAKAAIVQAGARTLKQKGFYGIGVDGLAASAGVTSGAFYSNFAGKEDLLREVIEVYLGNPFIDTDDDETSNKKERLKSYLRLYISDGHRDDPANGCVMPALSADVARSGEAVRDVYHRRMTVLIERMSGVLTGSPADRENKAWTILALMVGSVAIARALPSQDAAAKVIDAALSAAISLVEQL